MNLLNSDGSIVNNAASIIDDSLGYEEVEYELQAVKYQPCSESTLLTNILSAIEDSKAADNVSMSELLSYSPKIYGEQSRKISKLSAEFMPFAECIIAFIDQWCTAGGDGSGRKFGFEICSTKRSWFVEQNILTGSEYSNNGLSWNLYGNGLSVSVYYLEEDQLHETSGKVDLIKKPINFEDGSARVFIESAQKWFNTHPTRTGKYVKVYGVYPDLKTAIKTDKYKMASDYLSKDDTVFWGGLFSTYSNFTQWEYHPGYMPNDVWKIRQAYLNSCFTTDGNQNIVERIDNFEAITHKEATDKLGPNFLSGALSYVGIDIKVELTKYLNTILEIMEEDFLSMYNMKVAANTSSMYTVDSLFKWAKNNPYSLAQTITKYRLQGDTENSVLFYNLMHDSENSIAFGVSDNAELANSSSPFKLTTTEDGKNYLNCPDMFGDMLKFDLASTYKLPCDYMPSSADFDLIDLTGVEGDNVDSSENPLAGITGAGNEINKMAGLITDPANLVNEFGPLSGIGIDSRKALYNADSIADAIFRNKNYNEMIIPPNSTNIQSSSAIVDVTSIGKRIVAEKFNAGNEMMTPDRF